MERLNRHDADPSPEEKIFDLNLRVLKLERRLERERRARLDAEAIAERGLRELYERQQELALLETIATHSNQDTAVHDTLRFAMIEICKHTGWSFGTVHLPASDNPMHLVPIPIWHASDTAALALFIDATQGMTFASGDGLPGRVFAGGQAAWVSDVTRDANFPRREAAAACGLHAGFGFPVLIGREVAAVMEFFSHETLEPDASLLAVMAQIGTQLGRVIERKRAENQLIHDACHDALTGLPNRLLFLDRLSRAVARRERSSTFNYAVLFIDLDRFKLVNDSLGHAAGDTLLVEIAGRFKKTLAAEEASSGCCSAHTLARLGGDEFTVLLEELPHERAAVDIAERLQDALKLPLTIDGQEVYTTASMGVASGGTNYVSAEEIMRDADLAMYRSKTQGRARVEIFDQGLHQLAVKRLKLESDLRRALQNNEFVLHYQPIVALETLTIIGFEALVRWQRGPTELVPPGEFIEAAEETGLIVFIGAWVLREACATIAEWQEAFSPDRPLTISVNVSPRQFLQADFVLQVRQAIADAHIDPASLRLEVTEGVAIQNAEQTIAILSELRAFGVGVSIDDFGTGYSCLSNLGRLPFDILKIDRSFVSALNRDAEGRKMVQTILDLARNMKMSVVAEGTETEADVAQLRAMGCQFAQGYYFSKPLDRMDAARLLTERDRPWPAEEP